jgi:spermidine/putrescine transport system ATP-binding protein
LIAGLIEPTAGEIAIEGCSMAGVPPNRRPVNTVFQNYALFPHLNVAENIAFGPRRRGVSSADIVGTIEQALALVGMEGFGNRYPSELSGGQQQRIALARAIVNRPRVLLLDEPLGALDLQLRKRMQLELKHLQEKLGIAFIFVTHDQEEALVMADRIVVMNKGHIEQVGTGSSIYRDPATRFVASFIGEANLLETYVAEGRLQLKASGTPLPYVAGDQSQPLIMIRPEDISLGAGVGLDSISLDVVVRETIFLGSSARVHARLGMSEEIVFQPTSDELEQGFVPGQHIKIFWRRDKARLLEK